jgi:hypothetical protein
MKNINIKANYLFKVGGKCTCKVDVRRNEVHFYVLIQIKFVIKESTVLLVFRVSSKTGV